MLGGWHIQFCDEDFLSKEHTERQDGYITNLTQNPKMSWSIQYL